MGAQLSELQALGLLLYPGYSLGGAVGRGFGLFAHGDGGPFSFIILIKYFYRNTETAAQ